MITNRKVTLIVLTIFASIAAYFLMIFFHPFDRSLETYANIMLIVKSLFILANIGIVVAILLHDDPK